MIILHLLMNYKDRHVKSCTQFMTDLQLVQILSFQTELSDQ